MKSAGAVYRKLKEAKFRHLVVLYKRYLRRDPGNCRYNCPYQVVGSDGRSYTIRLCLLHQEAIDLNAGVIPHLVDVCQQQEDCASCNAYVPRYTREDIRAIFENELKDRKIKETNYPDICALEWVLERYAPEGSLSWASRMYLSIKHLVLRNKIL